MRPTRQRILCVDDHRDTCLMLVSLLGLANYDAVTAGTVDEALRLARGERFGLYILDKRLTEAAWSCVKGFVRLIGRHRSFSIRVRYLNRTGEMG